MSVRVRARCGGRGGEAGLVALEWLLVVAALAGLAALAVVVVQRVVDDTAEQVGASQPRWAAAALAALEVERQARAATVADPHTATWADWEGQLCAGEGPVGWSVLPQGGAGDGENDVFVPAGLRVGDVPGRVLLSVGAGEGEDDL